MNARGKFVLAAVALAAAAQVSAQATLYENEDFSGYSLSAQRRIGNLNQFGFNDRASSIVIEQDRWEVCEDAAFNGRCVVLPPGRYPSLSSMGLNDRVSSLRAVNIGARFDRDDERGEGWRRRDGEQLFSANVTSVRAVVGPPEQRCWVEREQIAAEQPRSSSNVGGAIAGAVIGGILGHQVGGGSGRDIATAGGAVAGAAIGSNVNRPSERVLSRDVQRCVNVRGSERPEYWDVTYVFRGQEHRIQTMEPPGATVTVNQYGQPRLG
jgi:uncharacterized protein YcfJ